MKLDSFSDLSYIPMINICVSCKLIFDFPPIFAMQIGRACLTVSTSAPITFMAQCFSRSLLTIKSADISWQ